MKLILMLVLFSTAIVVGLVSCTTSSSPETTQELVGELSPTPTSTSAGVASDSKTSTSQYSCTLTTEVQPSKAGYIIPGIGVYKPGEVVTLTAEAASGYKFSSWSGNASGTDPEIEITMDSDKIIIARFTDVTLPVISNVAALEITDATAKITWKTDEKATSQVKYGTTTDYQLSSSQDVALELNHMVLLTELVPNVTYHFRVESVDGTGNVAVSERDITFTTKNYRECIRSMIHSAAVFGRSLYSIDFSLTNNSSQMITINRVTVCDENGIDKYTVSEATIDKEAPEGNALPGSVCRWSLDFSPPYLVADVNSWHIECYCVDTKGNTFIVEGYFP